MASVGHSGGISIGRGPQPQRIPAFTQAANHSRRHSRAFPKALPEASASPSRKTSPLLSVLLQVEPNTEFRACTGSSGDSAFKSPIFGGGGAKRKIEPDVAAKRPYSIRFLEPGCSLINGLKSCLGQWAVLLDDEVCLKWTRFDGTCRNCPASGRQPSLESRFSPSPPALSPTSWPSGQTSFEPVLLLVPPYCYSATIAPPRRAPPHH